MTDNKSLDIADDDCNRAIDAWQQREQAESKAEADKSINRWLHYIIAAGAISVATALIPFDYTWHNAKNAFKYKLNHDWRFQTGLFLLTAAGLTRAHRHLASQNEPSAESADLELYKIQQEYKDVLTEPLHRYPGTPGRYAEQKSNPPANTAKSKSGRDGYNHS